VCNTGLTVLVLNHNLQSVFHTEGADALEQVAQGGCGFPIPGGTQGQSGFGSGQPGLAVGDPAHSRGLKLDDHCGPFQPKLRCDSTFHWGQRDGGINHISGQPVPVPHHPHCKRLLLKSKRRYRSIKPTITCIEKNNLSLLLGARHHRFYGAVFSVLWLSACVMRISR